MPFMRFHKRSGRSSTPGGFFHLENMSTKGKVMGYGEVTSGRENSACAFDGTTSIASTSGHTTGPPAENA